MGHVKKLTSEEASDRLDWLLHCAASELSGALPEADSPDERTIDKLREIARVARQLANHYEVHGAW